MTGSRTAKARSSGGGSHQRKIPKIQRHPKNLRFRLLAHNFLEICALICLLKLLPLLNEEVDKSFCMVLSTFYLVRTGDTMYDMILLNLHSLAKTRCLSLHL